MRLTVIIMLLFSMGMAQASVCPDPDNSALKWGEIPPPWQENPFSQHRPQAEEGTAFVRANILVYRHLGKGVTCTYKNSVGEWSIWLDKPVKLPTRQDIHWIDIVSGFVCKAARDDCIFYD